MSTTSSLRPLLRLPRPLSRRPFTLSSRLAASPFNSGPAPPRLPKDEQEIFERLQKQSTGAFSQPRDEPSSPPNIRMRVNQSPDSSEGGSGTTNAYASTSSPQRMRINQSPDSAPSATASGQTAGAEEIRLEHGKEIKQGEEFHPNMRRGAPPEFEGEVNPKTGEVGGPKNEPLRWGGGGDWSYNGRVTDF